MHLTTVNVNRSLYAFTGQQEIGNDKSHSRKLTGDGRSGRALQSFAGDRWLGFGSVVDRWGRGEYFALREEEPGLLHAGDLAVLVHVDAEGA